MTNNWKVVEAANTGVEVSSATGRAEGERSVVEGLVASGARQQDVIRSEQRCPWIARGVVQ